MLNLPCGGEMQDKKNNEKEKSGNKIPFLYVCSLMFPFICV